MSTNPDVAVRPVVLPPSDVLIPRSIARLFGLRVVPEVETLDAVVYFHIEDRPPAAPGAPERASVVYVGRTDDYLRRWIEHRDDVIRGTRPAWDRTAYILVEPRHARDVEAALIKRLLPRFNTQHKALTSGPVSPRERRALALYGMDG